MNINEFCDGTNRQYPLLGFEKLRILALQSGDSTSFFNTKLLDSWESSKEKAPFLFCIDGFPLPFSPFPLRSKGERGRVLHFYIESTPKRASISPHKLIQKNLEKLHIVCIFNRRNTIMGLLHKMALNAFLTHTSINTHTYTHP